MGVSTKVIERGAQNGGVKLRKVRKVGAGGKIDGN